MKKPVKLVPGDRVRIHTTDYRVMTVDGFHCTISEIRPDGTLYASQAFDTSLLQRVSEPKVTKTMQAGLAWK
jgi:hypothetical protein